MFRMPPQIDPAEEKKKVREAVKSNILTFILLCGAIKLAPIILEKVGFD